MRPVRVLMIAPSMRIVGGQSIQADRLRRHIGARSDVDLSFLPFDAALPRALARIPFARTVLRSAIYWVRLFARAWRYDVLHVFTAAHWSYALWSLPALAAAKLYRRKIVLNYRDGRAGEHLENWRLAAPTIRRMDAVVSPSGYLGEVFARYGIACRSIYNVIDCEGFIYRQRSGLQPNFLHNRGMEQLYNIPCALRAFGIVQRKYPNARMTVAGDGPMRAELEKLARELDLRNVQFTGAVSNTAMRDLLNEADIYVTTSNVDNMPGSLLECYASGVPVVATRAGGTGYIAEDGETALLCPLSDHEAVAKAALRLLEDPALVDRITRQAYEQCRARYSGKRVAQQWAELYRELAFSERGAARDS